MRWLAALALLWAGPPLPAQPAPPDAALGEVWGAVGDLRHGRAAEAFRELRATGGREAEFGLAVALLNAPPRSRQRLDEADALFAALETADPQDGWGQAATYYRGRIAALYRSPADPTAARALHLRLWQAHPEGLWGQLACLQLYVADLAAAGDEGAVGEVLGRLAADLPRVRLPEVRRNLHRAAGEVLLLRGWLPEAAADHLLAAQAIGFDEPQTAVAARLQAAFAALRTGRLAVARRLYEEHLAERPRDSRNRLLRERLEAAERGQPYP